MEKVQTDRINIFKFDFDMNEFIEKINKVELTNQNTIINNVSNYCSEKCNTFEKESLYLENKLKEMKKNRNNTENTVFKFLISTSYSNQQINLNRCFMNCVDKSKYSLMIVEEDFLKFKFN